MEDSGRLRAALPQLLGTFLRPQILLGIARVEQHKYTPDALAYLERALEEYPVASLCGAKIFISHSELETTKSAVHAYLATGHQRYRDEAIHWRRMSAVATAGNKDR